MGTRLGNLVKLRLLLVMCSRQPKYDVNRFPTKRLLFYKYGNVPSKACGGANAMRG